MNESWEFIEGYEGYYQVSSLGLVRSLTRNVKWRNSTTLKHGKLISQINTL